MVELMPDCQPDKRPPCQWVRMRGTLAREIREKEEAVGAGWYPIGRRGKTTDVRLGSDGVAEPSEAPGGRKHHSHEVPAVGDAMTESMEPTLGLDARVLRCREDHARRAEREPNDAGVDGPDCNAVGGLIAATTNHRGACLQSGGRSCLSSNGAGHLMALEGIREQVPIEFQPG